MHTYHQAQLASFPLVIPNLIRDLVAKEYNLNVTAGFRNTPGMTKQKHTASIRLICVVGILFFPAKLSLFSRRVIEFMWEETKKAQ